MSSPDPQFDPKNVRVDDYKFAPKKGSVAAKKKAMASKMTAVDKLKKLIYQSEKIRGGNLQAGASTRTLKKKPYMPDTEGDREALRDIRDEQDSIRGHQGF